ncbi:hypothetical protein Q7P37_000381 [Cladosporium fusiforme]
MGIEVSFADLHDTTTFFSGKYDAASVFITICCALAIYNAFELLLLIFTTFRRFSGLYFWSLLVSSFGLIPYTVGFMGMYFVFTNSLVGLIITCFGWPMVVTGQSLVLYSRLHVVLGAEHHKLLRGVKWMIIINGIIFHVPTEVVLFGAYYAHPNFGFAEAYKYIEKVQMTGFTVQELIISGLYVWKTLDIIHATTSASSSTGPKKKRTSRIMWQLFGINVFIVIMDVALLVFEFQGRHVFGQALKGAIYSVKLKLEFAILSKLVALTSRNRHASEATFTHAFGECSSNTGPNAGIQDVERGRSIFTMGSPQPLTLIRSPQADFGKGEVAYIERVSGSGDGLGLDNVPLSRQATFSTITPSISHDEQKRRRKMDEDLYASALRGMSE